MQKMNQKFKSKFKLSHLALFLITATSMPAFADGAGGNNSAVTGPNGGFAGAGGGGGAGGIGGIKINDNSLEAGFNGDSSGNGGNGARGNVDDKIGDKVVSGGIGGLVGNSTAGIGGHGGKGEDNQCATNAAGDCNGSSEAIGAGGGGGGGDGINGSSLTVTSAIKGGHGGDGGNGIKGTNGADAGSGGGGGAGAYLRAGTEITTSASITGGNGGNGGASFGTGGAGIGGNAGSGVNIADMTINNAFAITGGNGGNGGDGATELRGREGGIGGNGITASKTVINNSGTITAGNGGADGKNLTNFGPGKDSVPPGDRAGGIGISGSDLNIVNSGTISGGLSGTNQTQNSAINFTGGVNSLEIHGTSVLNGNVTGTGTNSLILGGNAEGIFDLSALSATGQYQAAFTTFEKNGDSEWTLSNLSEKATDWLVSAGMLTLDLANGLNINSLNFTGGNLTVKNGTELQSDIAVNEAMNLITSGDLTLAGDLTGSKGVAKTGSGELSFTGDTSTYTGLLSINEGALSLANDFGGSVLIDNASNFNWVSGIVNQDLTVSNGSNLTLANMNNTVNGNFDFTTGGLFNTTIYADGTNHLLTVNGNATVGGGLNITAGQGNYSESPVEYMIVKSNGLTGEFASVNILNPLLDAIQRVDSNNVYITVTRSDVTIADVGVTDNETAVGEAIESLADDNLLKQAVIALPDENSIRDSLNQLSGETYAGLSSTLIDNTALVRDAVASHMSVIGNQADKPNSALWVKGIGGLRSLNDSNPGMAKIDTTVGGFLMGNDWLINQTQVGVYGGYSHASIDVDARDSSTTDNAYHIGSYVNQDMNHYQVRGNIGYTWHKLKTDRNIAFEGYSESLNSKFDAKTLELQTEFAIPYTYASGYYEPFVNLSYIHLDRDAINESGSEAALSSAKAKEDAAYSKLGARYAYRLQVAMPVEFQGELAWKRLLTNEKMTTTLAFNGSDSFTLEGNSPSINMASVAVGANVAVMPNLDVGLTYQGEFGENTVYNGVLANLKYRF